MVDVTTAAIVCFFAVFISDYLVFSLGKYFGTRLVKTKFLQKHQAAFDRVSLWVKKYGMWAAGIFRFTPGLRFPGHFSCGMLGLKPSRFIMVDGAAALISVPTQVILIASFGEQILGIIKEAKIVMFSVLAVIVVVVLARSI